MQFDVDHKPLGSDYIKNFTISRSPADIAQWVVAAPMFLRGDIKTALGEVVEKIDENMILSKNSYSPFVDNNWHLPFITKVSKSFDGAVGDDFNKYKKYFDRYNNIIRSETGELVLDGTRGILEIKAPNVQGVLGFIGNSEYTFPSFSVKVANSHASVMMISKDGKPLGTSSECLLVVSGAVRMKNQQMNRSRTVLTKLGDLPVEAQVVEGELVFTGITKSSAVKVRELNPDGSAGNLMKLTETGGKVVMDLASGRSFVYSVSFTGK